MPVAVLKGCPAGTPVDMCKSSLAAAAVAYVKKAYLAPLNSTAAADTSSGMSDATIAGEAINPHSLPRAGAADPSGLRASLGAVAGQ